MVEPVSFAICELVSSVGYLLINQRIAGFSPVPFKLLTISSGFVHFNLAYFVIVSLLTRGLRFFLIAFLIGNFGPAMKLLIEKKLLKISIIASIIIIIFAYLIYKFLTNFLA